MVKVDDLNLTIGKNIILENLKNLAKIKSRIANETIKDTIRIVGLNSDDKRKVKNTVQE